MSVALIGDRSDGLGDELSLILTTLFESLLISDDSALNAPRFVIRKHRQALAEIEKRLRETGTTNTPEFLTGIQQQRAAVIAAETEFQATQNNVATLRAKLAEKTENSGFEMDVICPSPRRPAQQARRPAQDPPGKRRHRCSYEDDRLYRGARSIEVAVRTNDAARLKRDAAREALASLQETMRERTTLERQADRLRQRAALFEQRLSAAGQPADMQLLSAPAQIQIIDRPKDPRQRLDSRLKILVAGIVVAFAMSGAFALLSEQLDNRLRDAAALKTLAGAPVIVFPPGAFETEREADRRDAPPSTGSTLAAT